MNKIILLAFFFLFSCSAKIKFEEIKINCNYKFSSEISNMLENGAAPQLMAFHFSCIDNREKSEQIWKQANPLDEPLYKHNLDNYYSVSAALKIIDKAKQHNILVINEAHHKPEHRSFVTKLLPRLAKEGYKYLGIETLMSNLYQDSILNTRGYPLLRSGFYSKEPQFGDMIREALSLGFVLFSYESTQHNSQEERERNQAEIITQFRAEHSNEKMLIYCGFNHAAEEVIPNWGKSMTMFVEEQLNEELLTINQSYFSNTNNSNHSYLYEKFDIVEPVILQDKNKTYFSPEQLRGFFDLYVIHPIIDTNKERPNYVIRENRILKKINLENLDIAYPIMGLVYIRGEDIEQAVPVDVKEILNKKREISLLVPSNEAYDIYFVNSKFEGRKLKKN